MIEIKAGLLTAKQYKAKQVAPIAVIIALYNQGQYLDDAIGSVYNNTVLPSEIIVVDDKSKDDSVQAVVRSQAAHTDDILKVELIQHKKNKGLAGARNTGVKASKSEWIVCLDADDRLETNYFAECIATHNKTEADVIYTDAQFFGSQTGRVSFPEFNQFILRTRNICLASSMYSRKLYDAVKGYDVAFKHGLEDYAFWLAASQKGFNFAKCEKTGLYYRRHTDSMSMQGVFRRYKRENFQLLAERFDKFYLGNG